MKFVPAGPRQPRFNDNNDYEDSRFGPGYAANPGIAGVKKTKNQGKFYELIAAAEKQALKVVGLPTHGRGISPHEAQELSDRYNSEDAFEKYRFACDSLRGGYIAEGRR